MLNELLDRAREAARRALASDGLAPAAGALDTEQVDERTAVHLLNGVTEDRASLKGLHDLRDRVGPQRDEGAFERVLLLRAWLQSLESVPGLRVDDRVKQLMCDEVQLIAAPPASVQHRYSLERQAFVAFSKLATLRRFPAGQLHWEISGVPRSWLMKVAPRALPAVLYHLAARMRGLGPAFFPHLNVNRKDRAALLERESNRSYFRMAQSLARQPEVKGLVASSWLHSPDTMKASPHLLSLNRVFVENGALVTTIGPADPDSGVFTRSPERKQLFDQGLFKPTTGLVLWPRAEMLAWADAHPEFAD